MNGILKAISTLQAVGGVLYKQVVEVSRPIDPEVTTWTARGLSNTNHTVLDIIKWAPDGTM